MTTTIQVRQRGTLTLPAQVRDRYQIQTGDSFALVDFDGVLVLSPMTPLVPELAREIERARQEAGLSVKEMLADLRRQKTVCGLCVRAYVRNQRRYAGM
jgi:bifunctional DNA-binding transcriptional regulator/antitoxin component of YhaV-PrlF toxin-antitoxin module